jgi:hypothetical protein
VETVEGLRGPWVRSATAIEGGTLMTLEAEVQAGVDVDVEVQWLGDPLDPRDPSGRERRRSVEHVWTDRTLLETAEATFRPEAGQFEDLFVIHVQF